MLRTHVSITLLVVLIIGCNRGARPSSNRKDQDDRRSTTAPAVKGPSPVRPGGDDPDLAPTAQFAPSAPRPTAANPPSGGSDPLARPKNNPATNLETTEVDLGGGVIMKFAKIP